jgi:soluble lytic murein transglycosylase-like protein
MDFVALIRQVAIKEGVKADLFQAICTHESAMNPFAMRFEPGWKYFYFARETASKLGITEQTENVLQASSHGLCQIMGSVMRELGYLRPLTEVYSDPSLPLIYGAKHLKKYGEKYKTEAEVISAYNAGTPAKTPGGLFVNQKYVDAVSLHLHELRRLG